MDLENIKKFIQKNKIPFIAGLSCLIIVITACVVYFSIKPSDNILKLKKDEFKIELGENISKDPSYYLDVTKLNKSDAEDVINKSKVSIPKVEKVGIYKIKISYDIQSIDAKLNVVDTVPPSFEEIDNMTVPVGTNYINDDLRKMFVVMDGDKNVKVTVDNGGYDGNKEGTYTVKATAKDSSGNKTEYSFTITVASSVQEVQYSENTESVTTQVKGEEKQKITPSNTTSNVQGTSGNKSNTNSNSGQTGNSTSKPNTPSSNTNTNSGGSSNNYVRSVSISGSKSIQKDNSSTLTASINPSNASVSSGSYKWTSNNEGIVKIVGGNGFQTISIYGANAGTATITCTVNGVSASYSVTVTAPQQTETTDYSSIKLNFIDKNGRSYSKTFNQMTSGNSLTFNLADYGCVYDAGGGLAGSGFSISVDGSKWYQESDYPRDTHIRHQGGTFKFRSSAGTVVTITCVVNRANISFDDYNCIFNGAC